MMASKGPSSFPILTIYLVRHWMLVILFCAGSMGTFEKCKFGDKVKLCKVCCATDCCGSADRTLHSTLVLPESEAAGGHVFGRHGNIIIGVVGGWIAFIAVFAIFTVCFFAYRRKKNLSDGGEYTMMTEATTEVLADYGNPVLEDENKKEESFNTSQP